MNENTEQLIRELADKLGTTSEYLWGVLVQQAYVQAMLNIATILTMAVITALLVILAPLAHRKFGKDRDGMWHWVTIVLTIASSVFSIVWLVALFVEGGEAITALLNPEYWALKQLLP